MNDRITPGRVTPVKDPFPIVGFDLAKPPALRDRIRSYVIEIFGISGKAVLRNRIAELEVSLERTISFAMSREESLNKRFDHLAARNLELVKKLDAMHMQVEVAKAAINKFGQVKRHLRAARRTMGNFCTEIENRVLCGPIQGDKARVLEEIVAAVRDVGMVNPNPDEPIAKDELKLSPDVERILTAEQSTLDAAIDTVEGDDHE